MMDFQNFTFFASTDLANLDTKVPELPNFISLLHDKFYYMPWAKALHHWENLIFSLLIAFVISLVAYLGVRKKALIPSGMQNFLEMMLEQFEIIIFEVLGSEGKRFIPFLGTLFIYIFSMNVFGLIPLMKSPSSNLNITAGMALCVFCLVQYLNIKNMGFFGFLYHLAGSPKTIIEWVLSPLMFVLELISQLSRPVTLALRLFGNVLGEDILIGAFALMGVMLLANYQSPIGLPLQIPFMFLAVLTSLMQALVFTLLSAVYILLSIPHKEPTTTLITKEEK
jgi:F-type H+-transporting ATPase subunit a